MTLDTIFDLASLTKIVATTTSVMMLIEQEGSGWSIGVDVHSGIRALREGRHHDPPSAHARVRAEAGRRPGRQLAWHDEAIRLAIEEVPDAPPGTRFVYSDINFFLLGEIVKRISGERSTSSRKKRVFTRLGMRDTMFNPPAALTARIAPTESCTPYGWPCEGPDMKMLRGVVHDPTARRMNGVAGHAGLFGTAADLAIFCRMLSERRPLHGGVRLAPSRWPR